MQNTKQKPNKITKTKTHCSPKTQKFHYVYSQKKSTQKDLYTNVHVNSSFTHYFHKLETTQIPTNRINFLFFLALGFGLRVYTLSHSTSPFLVRGFFKTGSLQRFAQTDFKPRSS
jgi:hypothetical protein